MQLVVDPASEAFLRRAKRIAKERIPIVFDLYHRTKKYTVDARATLRRAKLRRIVRENTQSVVAGGPFAGMRLVDGHSWGDGDVTPKLLGVYEQELHPWFEKLKAKHYDAIVDVGCAEGYYAVGCAMLFPGVPVYAFDANPDTFGIVSALGDANGVGDRVRVGGFCDPETLIDLARRHPRLLVISDCEGYELDLFNEATARALLTCDVLVECHDFLRRGCTQGVQDLFRTSHQVESVMSGARNPNEFPFLANLSEADRWEAVCENRAQRMNWLLCEAIQLNKAEDRN